MHLARVSAGWRGVSVALLWCAAQGQQAFDTSGEIVQHTLGARAGEWDVWAAPFVRWDTVYFVAAAAHGYTTEQALAFQPGIVSVLRLGGYIGRLWDASAPWDATAAVVVATVLANIASWASPLLLYEVVRAWSTPSIARAAALFSAIAPASTSALSAPTPESFFSVLSLLGFWVLGTGHEAHRTARRALAAMCFAAATCFRANGILLAGYLVWHAAWAPKTQSLGRFAVRLLGVLPLVFVSISPWVLTQAWAYSRLCTQGAISPWCTWRVPLAYNYIQSTYWYVVLFNAGTSASFGTGRWRKSQTLCSPRRCCSPEVLPALPTDAVSACRFSTRCSVRGARRSAMKRSPFRSCCIRSRSCSCSSSRAMCRLRCGCARPVACRLYGTGLRMAVCIGEPRYGTWSPMHSSPACCTPASTPPLNVHYV